MYVEHANPLSPAAGNSFRIGTGKTLIALATYNEKENLPGLMDAIVRAVPDADLLIVDDDSPDGTAEIVQQRIDRPKSETKTKDDEKRRIHLIRREGKLGLGTAIVAAIRFAMEHDYDLLVNLDADWSHSPDAIPEMLRLMCVSDTKYDVVIGSRYVPGGKIVGWPLPRKAMSRCINLFARIVLGLPTRDNSGSFRCYRIATLRDLDWENVRSKGYSFFEEILFLLRKRGARFVEIPITFTERRFGKSKIDLKEAFRAVGFLIQLRWTSPRASDYKDGP